MNKLLIAALVASVSSLAAGCLGCSAFSGGDDRVLSRNSDSIILCDNGGFIATTTAGVVEGKYTADATDQNVITAVRGDNDSTAFVLTFATGDATATTTDLGDGDWTNNAMNQTELDHANIQCEDLVNRSWWTAQ